MRAALLRPNVVEVPANAVTGSYEFPGNDVFLKNRRFRVAAKVDEDVAAFSAFHHPHYQFPDTIFERIDDLRAFGFAEEIANDARRNRAIIQIIRKVGYRDKAYARDLVEQYGVRDDSLYEYLDLSFSD